jgi:parallel beta-helix repeat protein
MSIPRVFLSPIHMIVGLILLAALCIAAPAGAQTTYYVATDGSDNNTGTSIDSPFATVVKAFHSASPGDTIYVRGGTYRQMIDLSGSGGQPGARVHIFAYPGEKPVFKGSDVVTGWTQYAGSVWRAPWSVNSQQVLVNEQPLQQIGWAGGSESRSNFLRYLAPVGSDLNDCMNLRGSFFYDSGGQWLYVNLPEGMDSPVGQIIEASVRPRVFRAGTGSNLVHHLHLRGLAFRHSNVSLASNGAAVALREHSIIEDFEVTHMDHGGLSIGAHTIVRNGVVSHNGGNGGEISGGGGGRNFLFQNVQFNHNNYRRFDYQINANGNAFHSPHSYAGMKILGDVSGVVENCEFNDNLAPGLWFDYANYGHASGEKIIVRNNVMANNVSQGLYIEVSNHVDVYNNLIHGNRGRGIYLSTTSDIRVFNNVLAYNGTGGQGQGQAAIDVSGGRRPVDPIAGTWVQGYRLNASGNVVFSHLMTSARNQVFNNIFYNNITLRDLQVWRNPGAYPSELGFDNTADNNLYWRDGTNPIFQNLREFRDLNADGTSKPDSGNQQMNGLANWKMARPDLDQNSIQADPQFVDPQNGDFRLLAGSPAINAGALAPLVTTDFAGLPRPIGGGWDIGAHEFNHPPVVAITSHADGDIVAAGSTVELVAVASDSDGSVATVTFYNGSQLLKVENSPPYRFIWNNIPAGAHRITAVAKDNLGATGTSAAVTVIAAVPAEADAFVRDGSFGNANYGSDPELLVKTAGVAGFSREAFLRFNVASAGAAPVASAKLRLYVVAGPAIENHLSVVSDSSWSESTLTWNNKPASAAPFASWTVQPGSWVEIDMTDQVRDALAGGGKLSLRITTPTSDSANVRYASRDHTTAAIRPQLIIQPQVIASDDAYVRDGSFADDNYGSDPELLVKAAGSPGFTREAFVRFDLSTGVPATFASAKVRVHVLAPGDGVSNYAAISDGDWSQDALTWNTRPQAGADIASWTPVTGQWVEIDVTNALGNALTQGALSLRLHAYLSTPGNARYASVEHPDASLRPHLLVSLNP